jgi:hypothetical protein
LGLKQQVWAKSTTGIRHRDAKNVGVVQWPLFANCVEKLRLIEVAGVDSLLLGAGDSVDDGRTAGETIVIGVAIIAGLYFGREVLAVLLSFVLAPLLEALSRLRIGSVASVLAAVALAFAILGILALSSVDKQRSWVKAYRHIRS